MYMYMYTVHCGCVYLQEIYREHLIGDECSIVVEVVVLASRYRYMPEATNV